VEDSGPTTGHESPAGSSVTDRVDGLLVAAPAVFGLSGFVLAATYRDDNAITAILLYGGGFNVFLSIAIFVTRRSREKLSTAAYRMKARIGIGLFLVVGYGVAISGYVCLALSLDGSRSNVPFVVAMLLDTCGVASATYWLGLQ
jgi:hypothetical protein